MPEFEIKDIFKQAFGYEAPRKFSIQKADERKESSDLGQPFYDIDELGREHFLPVKINGYLIPFAVVSIAAKKTIISTAMPERGGSVHEIISIDDYAINIKGIMINDDNDFPEKEITTIHKLFEVNNSVELRSALTDIFLRGGNKENEKLNDQLHQVVIQSVNYPAVSGVEHAKPFEIVCASDMIFTLETT
jgi:Domain of unknown function (DUF6046)